MINSSTTGVVYLSSTYLVSSLAINSFTTKYYILSSFSFQIEDTKEKQRDGIQKILSKRFSADQIDQCFSNSNENISTSSEFTTSTEAAFVTNTTMAIASTTTSTTTTTMTSTSSTTTTSTSTPSTTTSTTTTTSRSGYSSPWSDDQATTPNPTLPTKCEAEEYLETREHYEVCASNKIREITAWLERRARRRDSSQQEEAELEVEEEKKSILTVCNAVRQLLYDCGNELGWCFTEDQVRNISHLDIFLNIWLFL